MINHFNKALKADGFGLIWQDKLEWCWQRGRPNDRVCVEVRVLRDWDNQIGGSIAHWHYGRMNTAPIEFETDTGMGYLIHLAEVCDGKSHDETYEAKWWREFAAMAEQAVAKAGDIGCITATMHMARKKAVGQ